MTSRVTTGSLADDMFQLRERKRAHEEAIKQLSEKMSLLETKLLESMDSQGLTSARGSRVTVSVSEQVRPNVQDWDEFYRFIQKHKYWHLLERRPSVSGCKELFETKGKIPGVVPFTQRRINMRTL